MLPRLFLSPLSDSGRVKSQTWLQELPNGRHAGLSYNDVVRHIGSNLLGMTWDHVISIYYEEKFVEVNYGYTSWNQSNTRDEFDGIIWFTDESSLRSFIGLELESIMRWKTHLSIRKICQGLSSRRLCNTTLCNKSQSEDF